MTFSLQKLTEGIRDRHVGQQNKRLVEKWSRTGLLRGMDDVNRENMATMLENQAAQVLRESNTMSSGEVGGFTNIAFPIVRRVFGGLIANELVSIQPMSLLSGLLFYLDYTYGSDNGPYKSQESIYGGPAGKAIQDGADATGGQYDLVGSGFSRKHSTHGLVVGQQFNVAAAAGINGNDKTLRIVAGGASSDAGTLLSTTGARRLKTSSEEDLALLQHDPQIVDRIDAGLEHYAALVFDIDKAKDTTTSIFGKADFDLVKDVSLVLSSQTGATDGVLETIDPEVQKGTARNIRRLNRIGKIVGNKFVANPSLRPGDTGAVLLVIVEADASSNLDDANKLGLITAGNGGGLTLSTALLDQQAMAATTGDGFGEVEGTLGFEADPSTDPTGVNLKIPEIDIKIESIPVTAQTRKLRARWSPELAQDLNAYHSMDAEVELTQILSEQIALEIDREILNDLLVGAKGANFFWSRSPGKFVNKRTGKEVARTSTLNAGPAFTGTVREWYETLTETVIDVANEIHRKTLRGSANFIVVSPDVATVLEASVLYRPSYSLDGDGQVGAPFTMGAEKIGSLSNRFTVYKDPYFPRNKILVGYKGGSYLETGFVYAPYVPLIVTPTIFQPEDFTPRKGVMTRYGKKMVRADFYGTVTCLDMNII
jgi:hypothetical protein